MPKQRKGLLRKESAGRHVVHVGNDWLNDIFTTKHETHQIDWPIFLRLFLLFPLLVLPLVAFWNADKSIWIRRRSSGRQPLVVGQFLGAELLLRLAWTKPTLVGQDEAPVDRHGNHRVSIDFDYPKLALLFQTNMENS